MPGQGLGLAPVGQRIFRTVRRRGLPKLRSEFSGLWELRGAVQLEPFKNGRSSSWAKTHTGKQACSPLSGGIPRGKAGVVPCLSAGAKKEPVSGPETLLSRPGGEKPARGKLPFSVLRGVVGPSAPGSQQDEAVAP